MYPLKIKEKYIPSDLAQLGHRFTVAYLGTYKSGDYNENAGSHPGVDIVPVHKHQEIFCVLDGKVLKVGEDGAYGKFIFIEHKDVPDPDDFSKKTTLFSCYEHLSDIQVNIGDIVKEGDIIGKTGNTGNSFGEHLHFQIDRMQAPFHAYWPFTGVEAKTAGVSFTGAVNIGLGIEKARMYTVNPLVYLDNVENYKKQTISTESKIDVISKEIEVIEPILSVTPSVIIEEEKKKIFGDIEKNDILYDYIHHLAQKGVITGYSDGTFRPKNSVTRTEFLKILFLVKSIPLSQDSKTYFLDIGINSWQKKYVNTALELGLVSKSNKKFFPNGDITRVEALKMTILLFIGDISQEFSQEIVDVGGNEWYAKYVEYALKNNLFSLDNNFFYPNKSITRYEVIALLYNITKM